MKFYIIDDTVNPQYHVANLGQAKAAVKAMTSQAQRVDTVVREVEVSLDKDNVLRLLNAEGGTHEYWRQWVGTPRGGLKEVEPDFQGAPPEAPEDEDRAWAERVGGTVDPEDLL